ncbi:MAG: response regulator [Zoogloeaceae bacterium]|nr:response regulator [Zoogloeaceae bacterium]
MKPFRILLVEDNPGDVRLIIEALKEGKIFASVSVAGDGVEALDILFQRSPYEKEPLPELILLDLNLPRMDGRKVLEVVKKSPELKHIPVVILTTSSAEQDILQAYDLRADCYIRKPLDLEQFVAIVQSIDDFWLTIVQSPPAL